ncbi:MAG: hypothetical protein IKD70_09770 [Eggerthellaceae bacterium]|nr:hypothetical protein [Eggerthellaceae bacterium]
MVKTEFASPWMTRRRFMAVTGASMAFVGLTMAGCNKKPDNPEPMPEPGPAPEPPVELTYDELSEKLYMEQLKAFYDLYEYALERNNDDKRHAFMAAAEAKLMASAVYIPTQCRGGDYAIGRVVPHTGDYVLWGNDSDRGSKNLVATEPIKKADRDAMRAKWNEVRGTGTYTDWVKGYIAEKGYKLKDTWNVGYTSDPKTWDVLATSRQADTQPVVNTYDGLTEYDNESVLQPALAESWDVSSDGKTYTFHLRQGVKWVDSQGREIADVVADDFVAGMQHMMDAKGGLEYLVQGVIVNTNEYITGQVTDFSQVGVSAPDDHTVVYTLCDKKSYFLTMLGYSVFAPMSRTYYVSQGGKFGADYNNGAADYKYGIDADHIAYCGPFLVTNHTEKNTIVFSQNPTYWDKANVTIKTITWKFQTGEDPTKTYEDMKSGVLDTCALNPSTTKIAKTAGEPYPFDEYAYIRMTDATSFGFFINLSRGLFHNYNNEQDVVSPQTEEQAARTNAAVKNVHFRRAVAFAFDRASYNAQDVGEDLKYNSIINSYTPGTFVQQEKDTQIEVDGKSYNFPAGTLYGEIMQAVMDADGVDIKVFNKETSESSGYDGWFNAANAKAELAAATSELAAAGVEISASNPIYLDIPYPANDPDFTNKANATKQSIEGTLGGAVKVNLTACADYMQWYDCGYYAESGAEANYDMYDCSGWGPDYGDPQTYLDTFLPYYEGYMTKCLGIF